MKSVRSSAVLSWLCALTTSQLVRASPVPVRSVAPRRFSSLWGRGLTIFATCAFPSVSPDALLPLFFPASSATAALPVPSWSAAVGGDLLHGGLPRTSTPALWPGGGAYAVVRGWQGSRFDSVSAASSAPRTCSRGADRRPPQRAARPPRRPTARPYRPPTRRRWCWWHNHHR